jgi:hypothetical protein
MISIHSGSQILDLGFWIPDPKIVTKDEVEQKFVVLPFFVATNITKFTNNFIFELVKRKIWANSLEFFYPKNCH